MTGQRPIYLDYQATTPVDARVFEEMLPTFSEAFGNAASKSHSYGWEAARRVETARRRVAGLIGCTEKEILFTSGATESNNLAIKGVAEKRRDKGNRLVSVRTEHKSVLDPLRGLRAKGFEITLVGVDREGMIDLEELSRAIRPGTILVSVMAANNEIGVLQPLREIGEICSRNRVLFHTDATQAVGKIPLDVREMNIDLLSLSGHKMYAPKGIGALFVRRTKPSLRLAPQMEGGGHERGMRSGTLNVPGIVGLGKACEICSEGMADENRRLRNLRERLLRALFGSLDKVRLNGHPEKRLEGNLNLTFEGIDAEDLLARTPGLALSTGSACTTASLEPSHVLRALGLSTEEARASIRISLGRFTTEREIDRAAEILIDSVRQLRADRTSRTGSSKT